MQVKNRIIGHQASYVDSLRPGQEFACPTSHAATIVFASDACRGQQSLSAVTTDKPSRLAIGWWAIRPHTLPLSISPVLAGSLVGWVQAGVLRLDITLAAAVSAACMQVGANLQNDAVDALNGTDGPDRHGPARVTQMGWASAGQILRAAWLSFALAALAGIYLIVIGGLPLVVLGLAALVAAYAYSGGPRPISRGPFGELVVLVFFGLVAVGGVAWLYSGQWSLPAFLMGLMVGLPAAAVLMINNLRDLASDSCAGRRTLAILLGPVASARAIALVFAAIVPVILLLAALGSPWTGALLGLAALLMALPLIRSVVLAQKPEQYNRALKATTLFQLALTLLVVAGIAAFHLAGWT
ncbi:MAG: 1,4-dihydroxy-2-naphthoate octaprenyltransferase [Wenzhouxiangella sp.]|nr:MAG: 1,4-dihydroxy-2-naphthoate octaprenyltransferase [Wenzhouxiangella sp.]